MEKKVNFNEMNLYVRYVQQVEGIPRLYYQPWRILYDNFLMFVTEGSITLRFENKDIEIAENEMCIIPPFLKNRLVVPDHTHGWYYGVHFDFFYDDSEAFNEDVYIPENMGYQRWDLIEMPIEEKLTHRTIYNPGSVQFPEKIRIHNCTAMKELLEKLLIQFQQKSFGHEIIVKSTFYEIMYLIINEIKDATSMEEIEDSSAILRYIQNFADDYERQLDTAQLALEYGMSPKKFRNYFKSLTQKTPKEYLIGHKIERAKELLATGRYQVGEVAYMLGYDDVFYFSKLFKRKTGISPKAYKEQKGD